MSNATIERVEVVQMGYAAPGQGKNTRKRVQYVVKFPAEAERSDKYFDTKREAKAWLAEQG
jgi:hypothetical protein